MTRAGIGLVARAPSGPGKTRLAPHLSGDRLRALREALLLDAIDVICDGDRIDPVVFFTPSSQRAELAALVPPAVTLVPQEGADLGERMGNAVDWLLGAGCQCALLVGSDIPSLSRADLVDAVNALRAGSELVIGPAEDGGYYLIGTTVRRPWLFNGIAWGSDAVLAQTLARANHVGVTPRLLQSRHDLDTIDDLRRVEGAFATSPRAIRRHLRAWLKQGT